MPLTSGASKVRSAPALPPGSCAQVTDEFNIADVCAVEAFDYAVVLVVRVPKFTGHAFMCGSLDKVRRVLQRYGC